MRDFNDDCYDVNCPLACGILANTLDDAKVFRCPLGCAHNCSYVDAYYEHLKYLFSDDFFDTVDKIESYRLDCINNS